MAPHDDLTAERAAIIGQHYACEDSWYSCPLAEDGCANPGEGEECTCGVDTRRTLLDKLLKTARQEALREGAKVAREFPWEQPSAHADPLRQARCRGNREASSDIAAALDRLASEGG